MRGVCPKDKLFRLFFLQDSLKIAATLLLLYLKAIQLSDLNIFAAQRQQDWLYPERPRQRNQDSLFDLNSDLL